MLITRLAGQSISLHPSGAAFLPGYNTLLIADAHFGKAVSFRKLGVPVPQGTTSETLTGLTQLLSETAAQRIVFLGD
ncbi:MAG: DEAD/DEAH box helicase, partial [Bdellovibrionales bacterium]|nr:DEAD/DEAH box helicase [Ramlibacter sp.]